MDSALSLCYISLALLNLRIAYTGIERARALRRSESAPLLDDGPRFGPPKALASGTGGTADIAPIKELSSSSRVCAAASVAFCIAGALNIAAGCWMIAQAPPGRALLAAGVAGVLLLSGAMNMGAAYVAVGSNRVAETTGGRHGTAGAGITRSGLLLQPPCIEKC